MKSDHRMGRCFLRGLLGDAINATLAAAGLNLRKLLRGLVFALIFWLPRPAKPTSDTICYPQPHPIAA